MKVVDFLSIFIAVATVFCLAYSYGTIPDTIPIHYGIDGSADGYGAKSSLWYQCVLLFALTFGFRWIGKHPSRFGFNHGKGTPTKANPKIEQRTKTFISVLGFVITLIISTTIQISGHSMTYIHPAIFLAMVLVPIAVVFWGIIYLAMVY